MTLQKGGCTLDPSGTAAEDTEIQASRLGAPYVLIITDDATRYRWVYFLIQRTDAFLAVEQWIGWMHKYGLIVREPKNVFLSGTHVFHALSSWLQMTADGILFLSFFKQPRLVFGSFERFDNNITRDGAATTKVLAQS